MEFFKRLWNREKRSCSGETCATTGPSGMLSEDPPVKKTGRVYTVPESLIPKVLELVDNKRNATRVGRGMEAHYELWRYINARCPETMTGKWSLDVCLGSTSRIDVVEVLQ